MAITTDCWGRWLVLAPDGLVLAIRVNKLDALSALADVLAGRRPRVLPRR